MHWSCYPPSVVLRQHLLTICGRTSSLSVQMHLRQPLFAAFCAILNNRKSYVWSVLRMKTWNNQRFVLSSKGWAGEPHPRKDLRRVWGALGSSYWSWALDFLFQLPRLPKLCMTSMFTLVSVLYVYLNLKALAHYKDFHKDFSEKIFVKIVVHI